MSSLLDFAFGVGTSVINNKYAQERGSEDRAENYQYGEMSADNADARQRALIKDYYTPEAQMEHIKAAGLSPSIMYGGSGASGTTGAAQGSGASGIKSDIQFLDPMTMAQIDLIRAQAQKTTAETKTINGDNERGLAEIAKIWSEKGANDAVTELNRVIKEQNELNLEIQRATKEADIKYATHKAEQMEHAATQTLWEAKKAELDFKFDQETYKTRVQTAVENLNNVIKEIALKDSEIQLNEAQVKQIQNSIELAWKNLDLQTWLAEIQEANTAVQMYHAVRSLNLEEKFKQANLDLQNKGYWIGFAAKALAATLTGAAVVAAGGGPIAAGLAGAMGLTGSSHSFIGFK